MTQAAPEFEITADGPISSAFRQRGLNSFSTAAAFVKALPYGRNARKEQLLTVFSDNCGTCGTKHALLKALALEHDYDELRLMTGIFRMNKHNSPPVAGTLEAHRLSYIPEAHNYFRFHGHIFDYTFPRSRFSDLEDQLMDEIEISPGQITGFKVAFHRQFLSEWLQQNSNVPYSLDELWTIREQCIRDLSNA
jgi:hypothetical protein